MQEYPIGQFSLITKLSVKTLRFYHEKGILVPARVDPFTGYRYYNDANVERARIIVTLRHLEFSIEEVEEIVRSCSEDEQAVAFLRRKAEEIRGVVRRYRSVENELNRILAAIDVQANKEAHMIAEKSLSPFDAVTIRYRGRYDEMGPHIGLLYRIAGRFAAAPITTLYWDPEYMDDGADVEVCLPVKTEATEKVFGAVERYARNQGADRTDPPPGTLAALRLSDGRVLSVRAVPAARAYCLIHEGGYDTIGIAYQKATDAVVGAGKILQVPSREVYLKGPGMIFRGNPASYRTEVQLVVE